MTSSLFIRKRTLYITLSLLVLIWLIMAVSFTYFAENQQLNRADGNIALLQLIADEDISNKVMGTIYYRLHGNICSHKADREIAFIRYFMGTQISSRIANIEEAFTKYFKTKQIPASLINRECFSRKSETKEPFDEYQ